MRQTAHDDHATSANPLVPHRKGAYLPPSDPRHVRFARLTAQQERHCPLDEPGGVGARGS
jgi:hypothetical protein